MKANTEHTRSRGKAGAGEKANGSARKSNGTSRKAGASARKTTTKTSYDTFKQFEGKRYTGMAIGRGHKWRYDEGDWVERKLTPDKWEIRFTTVKRRRGHAPEGSGVPVGTEYHWYVLADQTARKLDANNYATDMVGHKYKLSHKRAGKETWSASENARRRRLIAILKEMIADLEKSMERSKERPKARAASKKQPSNGKHLAAA